MNKVIIYPTKKNTLTIVVPSPEYLAKHTIEDLAVKDVPSGTPYKIINVSDLPTDRTFRDAWEYNE